MILFVIIISLLLTLMNIYLVIKIRQLKKKMTVITDNLVYYESSVKSLLLNSTQIINQQQVNIKYVRENYQILYLRWQKIRQIIILLSWLYRIGSKYLTW